jgi:hypothetical protein
MSEKVRIILARITDFPQVRFKLSVNMDRDAVPDHSKSPLFKLNLMRPLTVTLNNKCTVPLYTRRRIPLGALFTAFQSVKRTLVEARPSKKRSGKRMWRRLKGNSALRNKYRVGQGRIRDVFLVILDSAWLSKKYFRSVTRSVFVPCASLIIKLRLVILV